MSNKRLCPVCNKTFDRCKCDPETDWGVKVGSKEEAAWKQIVDNTELQLDDMRIKIELNEVVRDYAKKRMEEEHNKFISQKD